MDVLLSPFSPRARGLWFTLTPLVLITLRLIAIIVIWVRQVKRDGTPFYDNGYAWQAVVIVGLIFGLCKFLVVLRGELWIFDKVGKDHKVTLFVQMWLAALIFVYTEGVDLGIYLIFLVLAVALGGLAEVPLALNVGLSCISCLFVTLIDINDVAPQLRFVRYDTEDIPIGRAVSFIFGNIAAFAIGASYQLQLTDASLRLERQTKFVQELMGHLENLNTDRADEMIASRARAKEADETLLRACESCVRALTKLRPYLPAAFTKGDDVQFDEDHVSDDGADAEDFQNDRYSARVAGKFGVKRPRGRNSEDDDEDDPFGMKSGGPAIRQSFDNNADEPAPDPAMQATMLRERKCTILHVEARDVFDAPGIMETVHRSALFASIVVEQVQRNDGVVDIMTPWSITASFNGQTPCPRHAKRACSAALGIVSRINDLLQQPEERSQLRCYLGLDTRSNYCGVCGVDRLRARVVCGDGVELAKKLPSLGRYLHTSVIITENVSREVSTHFSTVPIDVIRPAWLVEEHLDVQLFELQSHRPRPEIEAYTEAFSYLRLGNRNEATRMLQLFHEISRGSNVVPHHVKRLGAIIDRMPDDATAEYFVRREMQWQTLRGEEEVDDDETHFGVLSTADRPEEVNFSSAIQKLMPEPQTDVHYQDDEEAGGGLISMFTFGGSEDGDEQQNDQQQDGAAKNSGESPGRAERLVMPAPTAAAMLDKLPSHFQDDVLLEQWLLSKQSLGSGTFSSVYLGMSVEGMMVALKCVDLKAKQTDKSALSNEVVRMRKLQHHNVVSYISCANIRNSYFIIIMEYVSGGSLKHVLDTFGPPPLPAVKKYVTDLLRGLKYLHDNGMIHCDIKPHNALMSPDGSVKLSDFGSSVNVTLYEQPGEGDVLVRGTSWYLAPEACRNDITAAVDIWSVGITVLELLTGKIPWEYRGSEANFIRELGKNEEMRPTIPADIPANAAAFCKMCLTRDAASRPTADALLRTPFLSR
jgi:class 3 adenylate cyclase